MATKAKVNAFGGMHTAGIYSDMTVDGPEIGTLVIIVDRAKNLPNRKSMGKQDPYCAARLGKEAKKTETDRRGGQTPKWDQELRFTVHDSPDYYQMKVSVFNDDKKTDLIGETWVNLQDVVVPGGGQNDLWHNLNCKGKYAGEIRIEITYYDSRPKQEKPSDKARQSATNGTLDGVRDAMAGPRQPKTPLKRRPLPTDPTAAPSPPMPTLDHTQTPQRSHQISQTHVQTQSPLQTVEYSTPSHRFSHSQQGYKHSPTNVNNYDTLTAKSIGMHSGRTIQDDRYETHGINGGVDYGKETSFRFGDAIENQRDVRSRYEETMDERRPQRPRYDEPIDEQIKDPRPPYQNTIDDQRRAPRHFYEESVDDQRRALRPLYGDPVEDQRRAPRPLYEEPVDNQRRAPRPSYGESVDYQRAPRSLYEEPFDDQRRAPQPLHDEFVDDQRRATRPLYEEAADDQRAPRPSYGELVDDQRRAPRPLYEDPFDDHRLNSVARRASREARYELPALGEYASPPSPGDPPPPPPVHRSNIANSLASNTPLPNGSYESSPFNSTRNAPPDSSGQEALRGSAPAYSQSNSYQAYPHNKIQDPLEHYEGSDNRQLSPRYNPYDDRHNGSYSSMQPTVEDPTSSPPAGYHQSQTSHGAGVSHESQYQDRRYDDVPSPAPLNLSGRRSAASDLYSISAPSSQQFYTGTPSAVSPLSYKDPSQVGSEVSSQTSRNRNNQQGQSRDDIRRSSGSYVPSVPPTLVAGMDPIVAQEVSERIYNENRASYMQNVAAEHRGRISDRPQHLQSYPYSVSEEEFAQALVPAPFVPVASSMAAPFVPVTASYGERQSQIATDTYLPVAKARAISPDPRVPARKSVSPSPAPQPEGRRLSGVPFGPDAYDALNPNLSSSAAKRKGSTRPGQQDIDVEAKIIMHDGREVDPSDHLPETSWAPEPETRTPKNTEIGHSQPSPAGAQPMPSSGRRQLRQAGRPQSMAPMNSSPISTAGAVSDPSAPAPAPGRHRLQKKANRISMQPAPNSSPLSPMTQYPDNNYSTRSLPRARTMEFASENGYGSYNRSSGSLGGYGGDRHGSSSGGPPLPAKVPINHGGPPMPPTENAWALLEEMKSIDLGSGRARRRNYENHDHSLALI